MRRILFAVFASAACVVVFVACSSSDSSTFTGQDNDSGPGGDSGRFGFDSGSSGSSGSSGDGSAMCTPTMPGASTTAWTPPVANPAACMAADIDAYFTACLADNAQKPTCDAYVADPAHATCVGCLEAKQGAGPIEWHDSGSLTHHDYIVNFPACVAIKGDPSADGCGAAWHTQLECERDACDACFAGGGTSDQIRTCACTAEGGSIDATSGACRIPNNSSSFCTTYLKTRLTKCSADGGMPPASTCLPASGEARDVYIKRIMTISCAP